MKVVIENVRKIKNWGITTTCKSMEEIQKVEAVVMAKLSKEFEMEIPELRKPRLQIYEVKMW